MNKDLQFIIDYNRREARKRWSRSIAISVFIAGVLLGLWNHLGPP